MHSFANKVAIVTGAGSGIGLATAKLLASQGAKVTIADINLEGAKQAVEIIRGAGGEALACVADVSKESDIRNMIEITVSEFGGLDILHNNVGDVRPETYSRDISITTMDVELWESFMRINLLGVMLGCKWGIPEMLKRGGGAVVNTSSIGSFGGLESGIAYGVSKAGVNALTRYVATAYGKKGIRCNAVAPGFTLSPVAKNLPESIKSLYLDNVLTPYLGNPNDIAHTVAFLLSDEARYITGQVVVVDGGENSHQVTYSDIRKLRMKEPSSQPIKNKKSI